MNDSSSAIDMAAYGFIGRFPALAAEFPQLTPGRVCSQERGAYRVITALGESLAEPSGRLRHEADSPLDMPVVGDFVMLSVGAGGPAVIHRVLERKSCFVRRAAGQDRVAQAAAANIDTVFICMSIEGDFNLRRLERYLTVGWDSGASPVVVLTKADLCRDAEEKRALAQSAAVGADVLMTSSLAGDGLKLLLPYLLAGRTAAFLGSSGVGKSTLINRLLGSSRQSTGDVRSDGRGRHTTTRRELILLPGGGAVIDTPGMRELGMWDSGAGLDRAFSDVEELFPLCRFSSCTHSGEPGCAVSAAIASGSLDAARWQSYLKLRTENAYAEDSESYLAVKERKFKDIAKRNRTNSKR